MDFNQDKDSVTSSGKLCCPPLDGIKKEDLKPIVTGMAQDFSARKEDSVRLIAEMNNQVS